jgi:hypothetical protein
MCLYYETTHLLIISLSKNAKQHSTGIVCLRFWKETLVENYIVFARKIQLFSRS